MAVLDLRVLVAGVPAGTVHQDEHGLMTFVYDEGYQGPPLSLSMPISNRSYGPDVLRPYLFGLLPDSELQRRAIGRELGVSANNPVTLLAHIGLDCPGAVQLCAPERDQEEHVAWPQRVPLGAPRGVAALGNGALLGDQERVIKEQPVPQLKPCEDGIDSEPQGDDIDDDVKALIHSVRPPLFVPAAARRPDRGICAG